MTNVALYTFGILDPAISPDKIDDFSRRGGAIYTASDDAPGFLGQAETAVGGRASHTPGESFGPWGSYALPTGLPDVQGHDPSVHIATLSLWRDVDSARQFVYRGIHRDALRHRHDWFFKGPWPGHVLWPIEPGLTPQWSDGVGRLEAMAREGESVDRFTFGSQWGRASAEA